MARGILYVASRPSSPERTQEYNDWYDNVHLAEVVALKGIFGAKRLKPVQDDGPYVALYELEGDNLEAIIENMFTVAREGGFKMSDALQMNPSPEVRLLELTTDHR